VVSGRLPSIPRVEEPVLARFRLAPIGAFDESDDPRAGTGVIGLPRVRERPGLIVLIAGDY
jgi:hypothetical protein